MAGSSNEVCLVELSLLSGISVVAFFLGNILVERGMCANVSHIHRLLACLGQLRLVFREFTLVALTSASSMSRVAPKLSDFSQGDVNIQTAFESV